MRILEHDAFVRVTLSNAERADYQALRRQSDSGESSCIALATARGMAVATDDKDARNECRKRALPFIGTIGILKGLVENQTLSLPAADALLARIVEAGYWAPVGTISELFPAQ